LDVKPTPLSANDITIGRNWTNNVGDAGFIEADGKVTFNGSTGSQITTDETFYNLEVNNPLPLQHWVPEIMPGVTVNVLYNLDILDGTMAMGSNSSLNINRDLNLTNGAGLYLGGSTNVNISIGRHWANGNTMYDNWTGFNPGTSTITFNGTSSQLINTGAASENFYNVTIDDPGCSFRPNDNIQIFGDLFINNGTFSQYTTGLSHSFYGNVQIGASASFYPNNEIAFRGSLNQTFENLGSGNGYFYNLIIDKTVKSGKDAKSMTVTLLSDLLILNGNDLTVNSGTLNLNGNSVTCTGDITINSGKITVDANAELKTG